jgi:hypothetical protein
MVNAEAIKLVVKELETDLSRWYQGAWVRTARISHQNGVEYKAMDCNTTFCIAGMAVHQAGYRMDRDDMVRDENGSPIGYVRRVAAELLGLNTEQQRAIFDTNAGAGDFGTMKQIITEQTGVTFDE